MLTLFARNEFHAKSPSVLQDYVPDGLSDFAEALANPIKYQSELEKRSEQLAVLMAEDGVPAEDDASNSCN